MRWSDIRRLHRTAARHTETWTAKGPMVYADGTVLIAEFRNPEHAALAAEQHNVFITLVNLILRLTHKLGDRNAISRLESED